MDASGGESGEPVGSDPEPVESGRDTLVVWDDGMLGYDFGPHHPMHPVRLALTMDLAARTGVLATPGLTRAGGSLATDQLIELVHDPAYVAAVHHVGAPGGGNPRLAAMFALGTSDNPVFRGMHEAAATATGATLTAARAVLSGTHRHGVTIAGGLHHAMRAGASGFCVYNDPAVAIAWLLAGGASRVAYVDVDVHHGDGVQNAFYDDPRVLTISLHQSGRTLFPGTGFPQESGAGAGEGTAVNVALPPGTDDAGWLRAFSGVVPVLLRRFRPDVLVTQHGCDTHALDPLADLRLTVDGQRASYQALHELAHEVAGGRWVACGGGGYALDTVVPRAWTHLLAIAAHAPVPVDRALPTEWREAAPGRVNIATGRGPAEDAAAVDSMPTTFGDGGGPVTFRGWDAGEGDPDDPLDRAVAATRREILPLHGLDPWRDR
jgi:acetoin utilization protein AcuC